MTFVKTRKTKRLINRNWKIKTQYINNRIPSHHVFKTFHRVDVPFFDSRTHEILSSLLTHKNENDGICCNHKEKRECEKVTWVNWKSGEVDGNKSRRMMLLWYWKLPFINTQGLRKYSRRRESDLNDFLSFLLLTEWFCDSQAEFSHHAKKVALGGVDFPSCLRQINDVEGSKEAWQWHKTFSPPLMRNPQG